jgi:hypothetical protein
MTNHGSHDQIDSLRLSSAPSGRFTGILQSLGWAVFLAMSWTWCIGMFLPVLLLRDLGWPGFWAFAIPNCVGAAAMGWILRDGEASRRMVERHQTACITFSLVTISFHAFFAAWLIRFIAGPGSGAVLAIAFAFFWMLLQWRGGGKYLGAVIALGVSATVFFMGYNRGEIPYVAQPVAFSPTTLPPHDAVWLSFACVFGFLLCPYLDLTFHATRQGTGIAPGRAAFTIGFCVIFPLMILFTAAYSGPLVLFLSGRLYPQLMMLVAAHFIVQSAFTVAAHARQLAVRVRGISLRGFAVFILFVIAAVLLGILLGGRFYHGLRAHEVTYRAFLGFYGLVFPAYVWLRVVPPARSLLRVGFAVIAATPMFWLGFIEQRMVWLVPGVLIPILTKWVFTPQRPAGATAEPPHPTPAGETGR